MKKELKNILTEWLLDCQNCYKNYGKTLPQARHIANVLVHPCTKHYTDLGNWIKRELIEDVGVLPPRQTKIIDTYSRDVMGLDFSLREEQHKVYWLIQDELNQPEVV